MADPRFARPNPWSGTLLLAAATLAVVTSAVSARAQSATVRGTVRDSAGIPIAGAEIAIDGMSAKTASGGDGRYALSGIPVGPAVLAARRLGFRPVRVELTASIDGTPLDVTLAPIAQRMVPVQVSARPQPFEVRLSGFKSRAAKRNGYFITRERIDAQPYTSLTDVLRHVPGLTVRRIGGIDHAVRLRGALCPPLVFIDGSPASAGEFDLDMIDPVSVEGVEVYSGSASVPSEFVGPRDLDRCGVVAVWSRPMRPNLSASQWQAERRRQQGSAIPVDVNTLLASAAVLTADQVDRVATLDGELAPVYPDSLRRAHVGGRVLIEFVVDTGGWVERKTIGVVSSTHPGFAESVRVALERAQFTPAIAGGRRVRQLIQLPVEFVPGEKGAAVPEPAA